MPIDRRHLVAAAALAITVGLAGPATAQQILKFSHTDTAVGSRQQAAELFAKKGTRRDATRFKFSTRVSSRTIRRRSNSCGWAASISR